MPRRSMLTAADRENLLALPESDDELIRHYTFSETDRALIRLRRGDEKGIVLATRAVEIMRHQSEGKAINEKVRLYSAIGHALPAHAPTFPSYGRSSVARSTSSTY